jgi:hypothetical protein
VIVPLRGNVPTRLRKLASQDLDAVVLACAGLDRLGLAERIDERIAPEDLLPAVGQGVLALEARRDARSRARPAITHAATESGDRGARRSPAARRRLQRTPRRLCDSRRYALRIAALPPDDGLHPAR